ncbi:glycosyltransferase [Paenarthrobacter sp. PAE-2]|jgi:spore maturation protein CgeB|uniref:CgeB family protein n=1 Tax=Paenarthrobacter sp. PAE-2 TaxID=2982532 RepID=UPI002231671E|nr:glycosyltransferase [Paenarthrobacter sp. PAE-2]MCW3765164.1 glycosyltransferase [Paenarthrobacter sp. PAE-2]
MISNDVQAGLTNLVTDSFGLDISYSLPEAKRGLPSVGIILDDFSTQCFAPEARLWPISVRDHREALERLRPEIMLIESAWNGNDGDWSFQITSPNGPKEGFFSLIQACRELGIPTVFWNKEDPPHFQEFLPAAREFDVILTSEESLINDYVEAAGHQNVAALPFAAQPRIHRPLRDAQASVGNVAFAGQYFAHKFPERREQMNLLFPPSADLGLSIYSRALGGDPNYAFPEPYSNFVVGSLPYAAMVRAYGHHKVFLNVNSVPQSKSMCARRIFELSSSKTAVVSVESEAISGSYAADEVFTVQTQQEAAEVLGRLVKDHVFRERATHKAWRRTLQQHTYAQRMKQVYSMASLEWYEPRHDLTAALVVSSLSSLERLLSQVDAQTADFEQLVVISRVGPDDAEIRELLQRKGINHAPVILRTPQDIANYQVDTRYIVAFSEAYDYAPDYANDLRLYTLHDSDARVTGKAVTGEARKPESAYVGNTWQEDVEGFHVLSGAWIAPADAAWQPVLSNEMLAPGSVFEGPEPMSITDRFNVRTASTSSDLSWTI